MRLKLFRANTTAEAMAHIRAELGSEALILGSRRVGDGVELTAALEPSDDASSPLPPVERAVPVAAWTPSGGGSRGSQEQSGVAGYARSGLPAWSPGAAVRQSLAEPESTRAARLPESLHRGTGENSPPPL